MGKMTGEIETRRRAMEVIGNLTSLLGAGPWFSSDSVDDQVVAARLDPGGCSNNAVHRGIFHTEPT
jgi:hypothetical protein